MRIPTLSIIIVTWNVRDVLAGCLQSLAADHIFDWAEVIVVDNQSSDGSADMVRDRFPSAMLITPGSNLGYARGNNLGIRQSTGQFIWLLNPDTLVRPGTAKVLVEFAAANPEYGVVGPRQYDGDGNIRMDGATDLPTLANILTDLLKISDLLPNCKMLPNRKFTGWDHCDSRDVPAVPGSAMLIPRTAFEQVGLLDETMFIIEDMDFCKRVSDAGLKVRYLAAASIVHYGGQSLSKRGHTDTYIQIAFQSFWLYLRKHYGSAAASRLVFVFMLLSSIAASLFGLSRIIGIQAASGPYRTTRAVLMWTLRKKWTFSHDLASSPLEGEPRRAEVS